MKILIVRHGDPDYSIDSLTEKGWKEAEYLSEKLCRMDIQEFYVSPLGRAKDTASFTLKKMNRTAIQCDWPPGGARPHPPAGCKRETDDRLGLASGGLDCR